MRQTCIMSGRVYQAVFIAILQLNQNVMLINLCIAQRVLNVYTNINGVMDTKIAQMVLMKVNVGNMTRAAAGVSFYIILITASCATLKVLIVARLV